MAMDSNLKDKEKSFGVMFFVGYLMVCLCHLAPAAWGLMTDSQVLLKFRESLSNATTLSDWNEQTTPCTKDDGAKNWGGVICAEGSIKGLQLENMGLAGKIDVETLKNLPDLRTLSFMNNSFEGPLPDLKQIGGLRSLYLSANQFSGVIPVDAFEGMWKLRKVYLAYNQFTGAIPSSLATRTMLVELRLEGNRFSGRVPEFSQKFQSFNVSNNALEGPIPTTLSKVESTSFSGNNGLCGEPLEECNNTLNHIGSDTPSNDNVISYRPSGLASTVIVAIVIVVAVPAILGAVVLIIRRRKREPLESIETPQQPSELRNRTGSRGSDRSSHRLTEHSGSTGKSDIVKLSFLMDDRERFDLPELLKASAEMLGSGCFGSSYKTALSSGHVMVVKRFKQMNNVGREEFQEHMRRLGRLRHPNLHPLVAYYYKKEEKLLITDYVEKGSLAAHIHGNQAFVDEQQLDWPSRLKIVKGVAQGLGFLYKELQGLIAAHGHLKSSNILLHESNNPVLTDYGLIPVINQEDSRELMVAYKSPEYLHHGRITKKTDVWSLGILILEVLTGKFPENFIQQRKGIEEKDLADWVNSVPVEEWADVVFDKAMAAEKSGGEGEIIKLLKIALKCCDRDVEKRLDLKEVLERIDEIKENDNDDDFHSSYASEGDLKSSRGMSDDFNFI